MLTLMLLRRIKRTKAVNTSVNYVGILSLHIINGILAAITFPFIYMFIRSFLFPIQFPLSVIFGIAYGTLLWVITLLPIHKPITGLSAWNHPLGKGPATVSFCGHIFYGVTMGVITNYQFTL
jgi:hypothetical protein